MKRAKTHRYCPVPMAPNVPAKNIPANELSAPAALYKQNLTRLTFIPESATRIRNVSAGQNLYEGAFTQPVLTHQTMNLTRSNIQAEHITNSGPTK